MSVVRGQAWGTTGPVPAGAVRVGSDAELGRLLTECRRAGRPLPVVALAGGDLWRSAGGHDPGRLDSGGDVAIVPVDVGRVSADNGEPVWFAAHAVARRGWWRGQVVAWMNAEFLGGWDVAPRSHPGDGRLDEVRVAASMPVRQRVMARRRLPTGAHLPHPTIAVRRVRSATIKFDRPLDLYVDGAHAGRVNRVHVAVEPDALTVCL